VESKFQEYKNQQAQELASLRDKQEKQTKRVLEQNQQREHRVRQRRNRMQQLDVDFAQLLSKRASLSRNSREYQELTIKLQAIHTEKTQFQQTEASDLHKQIHIDQLTSEADQLQLKLLTGLDRRCDSKEYQETTNKLNSLRGEFLKLADPTTAESLSNSFEIPDSYAPSSNQLVHINALMSATIKAGQSQPERINTLRLEGHKKLQSTILRGFIFVTIVAAFIATLVAAGRRGRSSATGSG